ncbi:MAG: hypothetical protein ACXW05_21230 [Gemmatirosa sp.]
MVGSTSVSFVRSVSGRQPTTGPASIAITNGGGGSLTGLGASVRVTGVPAGAGRDFLSVDIRGGTAPSTLVLSTSAPIPGGIVVAVPSPVLGTYTADVLISSPVAANSPVTVRVTMTLTP